jgi:tetratricopeptide (TPR) repeat protein
MGSSYYDKKDYDKAIECIEKGIQLNPKLGKDMNSIIFDFKKSKDLLRERLLEEFKNKL